MENLPIYTPGACAPDARKGEDVDGKDIVLN